MVKKVNKELDNKQRFFKDYLGRGWSALKLLTPAKNCYGVSCKNPGLYEFTRNTPTLSRRELLCEKCFKGKLSILSVTEIMHEE
jgi:hypothetical protein